MEARELIKEKSWVVIGDVTNSTKYAYKILEKFKLKGRTVVGVHPRGGEGVYMNLKEVPYKIDAIDLCINPILGLEFIREAKEIGITKVLIQPGAESDEIINYCNENNIVAIRGCALVEL